MKMRKYIINTEKYYDLISKQYDAIFVDPISRAEDAVVTAILVRTIKPGARILDCGCGTGLGRVMTRDISDDYLGIDISEAMIAQARRNHCPHHRGEGMFAAADMTSLDFLDDDSFDCVMSLNGAFSHVADEQAAAAEMIRVLKPGGTLLVMVYSRYSLSRLKRFWRNGLCTRKGPYTVRNADRGCACWAGFYTPQELKRCFRALTALRIVPLNILPDNFPCSRNMRRLATLMTLEGRLPAFLHGLGHALILTGVKR